MEEALVFFRAFELWIYLLLGLGGVIYLRKFFSAWQELRGAAFGLERENAQGRLNQAASVLILIMTMGVSVFILVSFVSPGVPGAFPLLTPTLDLLSTPSATLAASVPPGLIQIPQTQATLQAGATLTTTQAAAAGGCIPGQVMIASPQNGQEVSGVVEVMGTADIQNFGFYKFEMKRTEENAWQTIQAGNIPVKEGKLGDWDTRRLSPGEYQLALVVVDNMAKSLQPCIIAVRVSSPPEGTPLP